MSGESKVPPIPDAVGAMASFWSQWLEQSAKGTQALLQAMQATTDPAALQRKTLEAMSESTDEFMRTPAFMEMMKRNLKAMTDFKVMQDQAIHGVARQLGMPLADDIFGLFERLHSTERLIVSRLEAIEKRLESIEGGIRPEGNGATRKRSGQGSRDTD